MCGKQIPANMQQYCCEIVMGNRLFSDQVTRSKQMDICHRCFLSVCKTGFKPEWKIYKKNPNYVPGSKEPSQKYWLISDIETLNENEKIG